jgi:hypothetical protein
MQLLRGQHIDPQEVLNKSKGILHNCTPKINELEVRDTNLVDALDALPSVLKVPSLDTWKAVLSEGPDWTDEVESPIHGGQKLQTYDVQLCLFSRALMAIIGFAGARLGGCPP